MANYTKKFTLPGKTATVIYESIAKDIDRFLSKSSLGKYEVERDDAGKKISFKSSMASGTLSANENELNVEISLSFLASAFKSKIDEGVTKWLSKTFGIA